MSIQISTLRDFRDRHIEQQEGIIKELRKELETLRKENEELENKLEVAVEALEKIRWDK